MAILVSHSQLKTEIRISECERQREQSEEVIAETPLSTAIRRFQDLTAISVFHIEPAKVADLEPDAHSLYTEIVGLIGGPPEFEAACRDSNLVARIVGEDILQDLLVPNGRIKLDDRCSVTWGSACRRLGMTTRNWFSGLKDVPGELVSQLAGRAVDGVMEVAFEGIDYIVVDVSTTGGVPSYKGETLGREFLTLSVVPKSEFIFLNDDTAG